MTCTCGNTTDGRHTGPCREMDKQIAESLGKHCSVEWVSVCGGLNAPLTLIGRHSSKTGDWEPIPLYSASLDAIMPLVRGLNRDKRLEFMHWLYEIRIGGLIPEDFYDLFAGHYDAQPWEIADALEEVWG